MPIYELQEAPTNSQGPRQTDEAVVTAARAVLDQHYEKLKSFNQDDIVGALATLAASTAWASELRGRIQRHESRRLTSFRTKELDPFIEECDRQFKLWSRVHSVRSMEWDNARGGV